MLFGVIVVMIMTGCIASFFGAEEQFYCNVYCHFGKILLLAGFIFTGYRIIRDLARKR